MTTERQSEILEAAIDLIHKKGIQGLTIKNLAKSIGVTEPAIYRHFENKISILNAILDILKQDIGSILSKKLKPDATPLERIEQMFSNHFEFFKMNPAVASVVFAEELFRNEPSLTKKIAEVIEQNNKAIVATITEGQQRKEIRTDISAENLSTMIMGTLRLFVKRWQLTGYGFDLTGEGKDVARMVKLLLRNK